MSTSWPASTIGRRASGSSACGSDPVPIVLAFDAHARARSLRLALRFSGPGKLTIGPIKLYRIEG